MSSIRIKDKISSSSDEEGLPTMRMPKSYTEVQEKKRLERERQERCAKGKEKRELWLAKQQKLLQEAGKFNCLDIVHCSDIC